MLIVKERKQIHYVGEPYTNHTYTLYTYSVLILYIYYTQNTKKQTSG